MPTVVLLDVENDHSLLGDLVKDGTAALPDFGKWLLKAERLRGGKRDGVDRISIAEAGLSFQILPTRGMGLWRAKCGEDRVGWQSPVSDGPVHPSLVDLNGRGGLGWLAGFDELLARCGMESNGPPIYDAQGRVIHGLHGRVANTPARYVAVHYDDRPPHEIRVEGIVDETELFFTQLRLHTNITAIPGSTAIKVHDRVINRHDGPASFQMLYHWNFGPPQLDEGARFVAPARQVCPRTPAAAEAIGHYDVYGPPQPGFAEQVYYFTLHGDDRNRTVVMLRNRAGDKGVALRFRVDQLPCFTLWKSTQGLREGYVTGLEPGVNYPNPQEFERARGRVPTLAAGGEYVMETTLEILPDAKSVAAVEAEIARLQARAAPEILPGPIEPFGAEA